MFFWEELGGNVTSFCFFPLPLEAKELCLSTKDLYIRIWGWCKYIILRRLVGWSVVGGGGSLSAEFSPKKGSDVFKKKSIPKSWILNSQTHREFFRGIFFKTTNLRCFQA